MAVESRRQFAFEELAFLFGVLERIDSHCVLMGGQAACYWARRFLTGEPALREIEEIHPFLSKDVDFQGSRDAVIAFARALGHRADVPNSRQAFGNLMAGKFALGLDENRLSVEVLRKVPGLSAHDTYKLAALVQFQARQIRVLNPVAMLMAKSWNVVNIAKEGRHDTEQLFAMVVCTRAFLRLLLTESGSDKSRLRGALNFIEQTLRFTELPAGRKTAARCGVDWAQALPHHFIAASTQPELVRLREKRLPGWLAHIATYQRPVPENAGHRRLLEILAAHAEPLCARPRPRNTQHATRNTRRP